MDDVLNDQKDSLRSVLQRRLRWFTRLLKLVLVCFVMYQAPRLTQVTIVRDWPLQNVFEGIAGKTHIFLFAWS